MAVRPSGATQDVTLRVKLALQHLPFQTVGPAGSMLLLCGTKCCGIVAVGPCLHYAMLMISDFQISLALQVLRERRRFSAQDLAL